MKPAPCVDCPVIPICRLRYFIELKNKCTLVEEYLFRYPGYMTGRGDFDFRCNRVHDALNPVHWNKNNEKNMFNGDFTQEFPIDGQGKSTTRYWKERI